MHVENTFYFTTISQANAPLSREYESDMLKLKPS